MYESENFYVKTASVGAFSPGHVLVLPKFHIRCYGELPNEHELEYFEIMGKTKEKIKNSFSTPIASELGVYGQSIPHAHTHLFPSSYDNYSLTLESMLKYVPDEIPITNEGSIEDIKRIFSNEGEYVSLDYDKLMVMHPKNYNGRCINLRHLFVQATGLKELAKWQEMPVEFERRNDQWVTETIEALKE